MPQSQNVTAGEMVVLGCATTNVGDGIAWIVVPPTPNDINTEIVGGGKRSVIRFTALLNHSEVMVHCIVTDITIPSNPMNIFKQATVSVQGEFLNLKVAPNA